MERKRLLIALFILLFILLLLYLLLGKDTAPKLTDKVEVINKDPMEITEVTEKSKHIDEFILSKIPNGENIFFKREQHIPHSEEDKVTLVDLKKENIQFVYSSFVLQDLDQLTVAFSSESIRSLQDNQESGKQEDLLQKLTKFLQLMNRNGMLEKIDYQFEIDKYKQETNKGLMNVYYTDNLQISIDIEVQQVGDDEHLAYEIITPLKNFEEIILKAN